MVNGGPLADCRRWCTGWSRRHCLIFILVFAVAFFFYSSNIIEFTSDWSPEQWIKNQKRPLQTIYKSQRQRGVSSSRSSTNPVSPPELPDTTNAALVTANTSSSAFPQSNITSRRTANTSAPQDITNDPVATHEVTQEVTVRETPVPYVSPGPYVVEYPYEYHFIINEPQRCEQEKPFVVLVVPVAPNNRAHRDIIRSTWGSESSVQGKVVTVFFLLGLQGGVEVKQLLLQESSEHRDLIQSDFLDCYKNLTIKTMVMLEWLNSYCSSASYAMKIDSDMFLNVPNLVSMLLKAPERNYMTGLVARGAAVLRDLSSKWYLPVELYPQSEYPRYALGLGYILSLDLPKKLIEASRHIKALYIEDVYLGLCMQYLGLLPTDPPNWNYFHVFPLQYSRCTYSGIVATTTHPSTDRVRLWKDFKKPGPYC